jgi:hypothetical protein
MPHAAVLLAMTDFRGTRCVVCQAYLPGLPDRFPVLYVETPQHDCACLCRECASSFASREEAFKHLGDRLLSAQDTPT